MGRPQTTASTPYRIIMLEDGTNISGDHAGIMTREGGLVPILSRSLKNAGSGPSPFAPALWDATRSEPGAGTGQESETRTTAQGMRPC